MSNTDGDEHKEAKQSQRAEQRPAQQAERSASLSEWVTWLTASWFGGYSDGSAAVSTDRLCGDPVIRNCHVVSNRPIRRPFRRHRSGARRRLS